MACSGFLSLPPFREACCVLADHGQTANSSGVSFRFDQEDLLPNLIISRRLPHTLAPSHENPPRLSPSTEQEAQSSVSTIDQNVIDEGVSQENIHEEDEDDEASIPHSPTQSPSVEYSIVLSPSYQVPVLYFTLRNLPSSLNPTSIETVYQLLTPRNFTYDLERTGVMGGISIGNHPLTDFPSFYVHPCNTAEAMRELLGNQTEDGEEGGKRGEREVSPIKYLTAWLGLVGSCVGLHIPRELALALTTILKEPG